MTSGQTYTKTTYMVLCGLFAALTAICSLITIPLGFTPVPLNLGTLAVFITGGLLGRKYGVISMAVYVLLGCAGIPVFAGFRAGLSVLAGPTGGYIAGYILAVFIIGLMLDKRAAKVFLCIISLTAGLAACYTMGTLWFMLSTGNGLWPSLTACVFPFLPGDAVKIAAAAFLIKRLRPRLS